MINFSDAKCSVQGITLAAAGEMSRRLQPVYSVTLKHGVDQASVVTNSHDFIFHNGSLSLQLICNFDAAIGCTSPEISAPCQPLTSTLRQEMQSLAAFADDSRLYSTGVTGCSNAQVEQQSARENIVSHDMRDVIHSLLPLLSP